MTVDSRNLVGAGLALAIIGLAAWGSSALLTPKSELKGTVEVRPLVFSTDEKQSIAAEKSK